MSACVLWSRYLRRLGGGFLIWTIAEVAAIAGTLFWCLDSFWQIRAVLPAFIEPWFFVSGAAWAFLVVVLTLASGRGLIGHMLSTAPMVLLGEISFSVYMLHQILMKIYLTHGLVDEPAIVFFVPLMAVSAIVFFLIESPARDIIARRVKHRNTRVTLLPNLRTQ
jgi:peptidoglycan/LPS O-acetylase OafA/YrhL